SWPGGPRSDPPPPQHRVEPPRRADQQAEGDTAHAEGRGDVPVGHRLRDQRGDEADAEQERHPLEELLDGRLHQSLLTSTPRAARIGFSAKYAARVRWLGMFG